MGYGQAQAIGTAGNRVMEQLVAGLELEFGRGAGEALAQRFLEAEEVDFLWDARVEERWIGSFENSNDDGYELERIAILARLDGDWIAATLIVDGDGRPHGLMGRRGFKTRKGALAVYGRTH